MPRVLARPQSMQNGDVVTEFRDTTLTSFVSYTYPEQQTSIVIENKGYADMIVNVGTYTNQNIQPGQKLKLNVNFTNFDIRSTITSQEFYVKATIQGTAGSDPTLRQDINSLSAQLVENEKNQSYFMGSTLKDKNTPTKGIVVIITDDANTQDYTVYKTLFKNKGVPFCTAVITAKVGQVGLCTKQQLLELQADGHEIMSHTANHPYLANLTTKEEIESELATSKNWLLENGFNVESIAYPFGSFDERVKEIAKKYYRSARCSDYGLNGLNDSPIETFELKSIWLDSNVVVNNDPSGFTSNTLDYYKYYIDQAYSKNSLLIISTHSWNIEQANLTQLLSDVVDYAKSKCDILTLSQAINKVGNIIETGSFGRTKPHNKHFAVGYNGKIDTNNFETVIKEINSHTGATHIDNFEDYVVTSNRIDTATASSSGMPESTGGILYTYKIVPRVGTTNAIYNYQIYHVLTTGNIYKRLVNSDRSYGSWKQVNNKLEVTGEVTTLDAGITSFNEGVTINYLTGTNASISPTKTAGTLVTYKVTRTSNNAFSYQEFSEYNGRGVFRRFPTGNTTWSSWLEVGSKDSYPAYDTFTGSSAITTFPMGVTYNTVITPTASSTGLPESVAGTLITYKIHATDHSYNYQTYHVYGTAKMYKRSFASDGTPTAWTKISAV